MSFGSSPEKLLSENIMWLCLELLLPKFLGMLPEKLLEYTKKAVMLELLHVTDFGWDCAVKVVIKLL